ncbi:MAG: hypothetical protein ACRD2W_14605 [Acidimicrobiales bacterium]
MRCDEARASVSAQLDGEAMPGGDSAGHLAGCGACQTWMTRVESMRRAMRFEVLGAVPDIAGSVMSSLSEEAEAGPPARLRRPRRRSRPWLPAAAALVAGIVVGATVMSGVRPGSPPALVEADIASQVAAAQVKLSSLTATLDVEERGWHRDVPVRTYHGHLAYRSPESLALTLADTTGYPSGAWRPNDVALVVDGVRYWQRGLFNCPSDAQPGCTPPAPRVRAVVGREPFTGDGLGPLELVLPASGFRIGETATVVEGRRPVAGREAVGVLTSAAQLDGFLGGLRQAGNWREVHPADAVEVWLDAAALVPLSVEVRAGPGADRERWAEARGYTDKAGEPVLTVDLGDVRLNVTVPDPAFPPAPSDAVTADAGFRPAPPTGPTPAWLPPGMVPARSGVVSAGGPAVAVTTFTDGRAWIKVASTPEWQGGRLFGDLGAAPRTVPLGVAGTGYVGGDGDRVGVGIHSPRFDLVVTGSLPLAVLERVAASLGIVGEAVPPSWAEAGWVTLDDVAARIGWPLLAPTQPPGFSPPAARIAGDTVTLAYAGPGVRSFRIVQQRGTDLSPPAGADVRGVRIRGTVGRYSPSLGLLEFVEQGTTVVGIESASLALAELVEIAEGLRRL